MHKAKYVSVLLWFLSLCIISCSDAPSAPNEIKCVTLKPQIHDKSEEWRSLSDEFDNFVIIPLENREECLLSDVCKMIVTDSSMIFFDRGTLQQVLVFSQDGKFSNRIGTKGHAKGEYQNLQNITSTSTGDTVVMIAIPNINIYNKHGRFLSTLPIKNEKGMEDILYTANGVFLGYFHRQDESILAYYNNRMENKMNIIETPINPTGYPLGMENGHLIQQDGKNIACLDALNSSFYVFDVDSPMNITKYTFELDNLLTEEKARQNVDDENMFSISSYQIHNGTVRGVIGSRSKFYDFKFRLSDKNVEFYTHKDFNYYFDCCHSGYFYRILPAESLIDIMDKNKRYNDPARMLLGSALSELEGKVSPTDNYYIVKMQVKK